MYLPAVEAPAPAPPSAADVPKVAGQGETVLVVEDEPALLAVTARMLRDNGYAVLEAGSYDVALALATEHEFDLLLSDSVMPKMPGREVAERIRALHPGKAVLFMSGYRGGVVDDQGTVERGAPLLQKPFDERTLMEAVHAVLHQVE